MTGSPLNKFLFTPVVISAAVFAALTIPLAVLGSKPVTIQLQEEPVFSGQLRDVATPYLGLATALSLGAGVASVAVTGWRQSIRKSSQVESQLSDLERNLKEKEAQLEAIKLSDTRVEASGLSEFLDENATQKAVENTPSSPTPAPEPITPSPAPQPVIEPLVIRTQPVNVQPVEPPHVTVQEASARFASSQGFLGYSQAKANLKPPTTVTSLPPKEVAQLQVQLQQIKTQMESLQAALQNAQPEGNSDSQAQADEHGTESGSPAQLRVVKSWSVNKMSS
jgi:hypothetical protein